MKAVQLSDEALYERLLGGDLGAFDALYERYARHLFGFIARRIVQPEEAEDVLHEAFLVVLRERRTGRTARCFRAWLFEVARNLCRNRWRTQRRADHAASAVWQETAVAAEHPERALHERQVAARLQLALSRIPASLAEIYALRASGMSYDEMAQLLGVPQGTVKSRMHEMVRRLREEVRQ